MNVLASVQDNTQLETLEEQLKNLAEMIRIYHKDVLHGARVSVEAARQAGVHLMEAKALVAHGQWTAWLNDHCLFSERTAQKYMRVARRWDDEKIPSIRAVTLERALDLLAEPSNTESCETADPKPPSPAVLPTDDFELQSPLVEQETPAPAAQHFKHAAIVAGLQKMAAEVRTLTDEEAAAADGALNELRMAVCDALDRARAQMDVK
jgi:Protein of unknown function (DUF3102)